MTILFLARDNTSPFQLSTATAIMSLRGSLCCPKHLGEHAHEDDAEGRHACAHDADVDLDVGPGNHVGLVPGRVAGFCETYE